MPKYKKDSMKLKIIKVGNSSVIRIPRSLLLRNQLRDEIEIEVCNGQLRAKPRSANRRTWDAAFKKMAKRQDDILLDNDSIICQSKWDQEEWK